MNGLKYILLFVGMVLFQVLIGKNLILLGTAFCFVYLLFLLMLPINMNVVNSILLGFLMGVVIDMTYNTGGMHAAASVFVMFFRDKWLNSITPQGGYEPGAYPSMGVGGVSWFIGYAFPIVFIHHVILFFLESYGFSFFWSTLNKAFFSTIFTVALSIIFLIIAKRGSGR